MSHKNYQHQQDIIDEDKKKFGIFLGTGGGKTKICLEMAEGKILIIMPKQQFLDKTWEDNAAKFGINKGITTISKETFRRDWRDLPPCDTLIIDECHNMLGVMPETRQRKKVQIPKTSQMFEATLNYITFRKPKRLYLCSATPVSKPMNIWAVAKLYGVNWDFFKFREAFYFAVAIGARRIWLPKKDEETTTRLANLVKRFGYTGGLNDFFDVPEQTHKEVFIDLTEAQSDALKDLAAREADPLVRRGRQRTIENGVLYGKKIEAISETEDVMTNETTIFPSKKIDYILERAQEFKKMLIFAQYTAQVNEIARCLREEGYNVSTLTGKTKDRGTVVKQADASEACIVVAQSSIAEGYQLPTFPCVIFASKSWRYLHYEQGLGRVLRSDALKKNLYIHLIVRGGPDHDCHKSAMAGEDFAEKVNFTL